MKTVIKLQPIVAKFFSEDGQYSITQANAIKNQNTNEAEMIVEKLNVAIYNRNVVVIGPTGSNQDTVTVPKLTPADFGKLGLVMEQYAQNAVLGHGIQLFKSIETNIRTMSNLTIQEIFGITVPELKAIVPRPKSPISCSIDSFMELETIESMVVKLEQVVLDKLDYSMILRGLTLEAKAAVLGKQLTKKESFLKVILRAQPEILEKSTETNFGFVVQRALLAYSESEVKEFSDLRDKLYSDYTTIQSQVNGIKKTLKDLVRKEAAEMNKQYKDELETYQKLVREYNDNQATANTQAESLRLEALKELASLKIKVAI